MSAQIKSFARAMLVVSWLVFLSGCATQGNLQTRRFYEEEAANLVLRYASDQAIFRLKPDAHDGPFFHIYTRQQLFAEDSRRVGNRDLAVVLVGHQWTKELDRQICEEWVATLKSLKYRRVVILRSDDSGRVNGLTVVEDRHWGFVQRDADSPTFAQKDWSYPASSR